jgi:cytochrome P450
MTLTGRDPLDRPDHPLYVPDDAERDPFGVFDRSVGVGDTADPYTPFETLRSKCPVHPSSELAVVMGEEPEFDPNTLLSDKPPVTVYGFEAVRKVLGDGGTFSSTGYANSMGLVFGHSMLEMDEPEHRQNRNLVQQAFTRKAMERWEVDLVRPIVDEHIDRFVDRGHADLVSELTFPFPVAVIAGMLGLPREDLPLFHRRAVEVISIAANPEIGLQSSAQLGDYFAGIIAQRRVEPRDDVISVLAHAEAPGDDGELQHLTDEDIFAFLKLLLPAGAETTYRSSSNLLFGLLDNPDQLAALRDDRSLMPQAIEEGLRWEPPLTGIGRLAIKDTEIGGVPIEAGTPVGVCLGSANHDPTRWESPEQFDMFRKPLQHMAFAFGPHMCLGMHLARMETTVVLNAVLDRLPNLRLDTERGVGTHVSGLVFRAPPHLPVLFG